MLLHKIFLVTSQKLHLLTYGKTCIHQNSNSKSDYGSHQNSAFLFRYKSARNGEQLKGKPRQSAKALKKYRNCLGKNRRNNLKLPKNPAIKRNLHTNIG